MNNRMFNKLKWVSKLQVAALIAGSALSAPVLSMPLLDGLGGPAGYGELAMFANDDGSSNALNLNFTANFFGTEYNQFFINNNGNISFNRSVSNYTPSPFPSASQPMIAPFWADVDTRGTGAVHVGAANDETTVVTWNDVGYYSRQTEPTNNFQLILRDRSADTGNAGDFDIEFRYDELNWTTGDASGGTNGQGGTPAQAGFDAGDGTNFFVLPGSFSADVVNLQNQTNVADGEDGQWVFAIRNGSTPGETPENPLLPVVIDETYVFEFDVELNELVFIDPDVAVGYDYEVTDASSPLFASVLAPTGFGDDLYDLYLWDGTDWLFEAEITGGVEYLFDSPLSQFRLLGIEASLGVDPTDPTAFVTGLTFDSAGIVNMTQTPITVFVPDDNSTVSEPGTWGLFVASLATFVFVRRRKAA